MLLGKPELTAIAIVGGLIVAGVVANHFANTISTGFNQAESQVGQGTSDAISSVGTGVAVGAGGALLLLPLLLLL